MQIRPAETGDVPSLMSLMVGYIVDFYRQPDPGPERLGAFIHHLLQHPEDGVQLVADGDAGLVGFTTLYCIWSTLELRRHVVMNDLYVAENYRGQHVGEMLFQAVVRYARDRNLGPIQWETAKDNLVAQALYRKMGGRPSRWIHYELD